LLTFYPNRPLSVILPMSAYWVTGNIGWPTVPGWKCH
jgi:hypothetical protein